MTTAAFTLRDSIEFFFDDYDVYIRCAALLLFAWFAWIGDDARYELWCVWVRLVVLFFALLPLCALVWCFAPATKKQETTFLKWMIEAIYATKRVHYCGDGECDCFAPRAVMPSTPVASSRAVSAPVAVSSDDILAPASSSCAVVLSGPSSSASGSALLPVRAVSSGADSPRDAASRSALKYAHKVESGDRKTKYSETQ